MFGFGQQKFSQLTVVNDLFAVPPQAGELLLVSQVNTSMWIDLKLIYTEYTTKHI